MKRGIIIIICVLMAAVLAACGSSSGGSAKMPKALEWKFTEETYQSAVRALEIMDKYNSGDLTADEAETRLESIQRDLESESIDDSIKSSSNTIVGTDIFLFTTALDGSIGSTYSAADSLREMLEEE